MTPLSQLTHGNFLIATHDALATAMALLASFYLRYDAGAAFYARLLLRITRPTAPLCVSLTNVPLSCTSDQPRPVASLTPALYAFVAEEEGAFIFSM